MFFCFAFLRLPHCASPHYSPSTFLLRVNWNHTAHRGSSLFMEPLSYCERQRRRVLLPCAPLGSPSPRHCQRSNWLRVFLAVLGEGWNLEEDALAKLEHSAAFSPLTGTPLADTAWTESGERPRRKKKKKPSPALCVSLSPPAVPQLPLADLHSTPGGKSVRVIAVSFSLPPDAVWFLH